MLLNIIIWCFKGKYSPKSIFTERKIVDPGKQIEAGLCKVHRGLQSEMK